MTQIAIEKPILVLGATGKTGRRVAELLKARGRAVRLGSRQASPAFDWMDPAGWEAALDGVSAVYISYFPDLAAPGAPEAIEAFAARALAQGVRRLVLLSGRGEDEAQQAEQVLRLSGADWTILRAAWFAQNFSESVFLDLIRTGTVALAAGDIPEPFVDADDIAEIAAKALTEGGHAGQLYDLTGPACLTFAEAVAEIARAAGRPIRYVRITPEEQAAALAAAGTPSEVIDLLTYLFTTVLDGRNAQTADGVQRALGRPARSFADYAARAAATGVWNV